MFLVKVSTPWNHTDYNTRIKKVNQGCNYKFDFSEDCKECDFWIVWGGIKSKEETVLCPHENLIFITEEVHDQRLYNQSFLDQFSTVITNRTDINHKKIISPGHELNTWLINKSFEFLSSNIIYEKTKTLSVICSDQTWLPGHKLRFAFVNKLIGHFKDKIDVFGRGFNFIEDKFDALAPYKYSVAIENSCVNGYFTEKLTDCYLTDTMPLYYGCPDISNYFIPPSLFILDPNDFIGTISKIEQLLNEDPYQKVLPLIQDQKRKYLEEFHIFSKIPVLLDRYFTSRNKKNRLTVKNENFYNNRPTIKKLFKKIEIFRSRFLD